jgi:hypothetical protein
MALRKGSTLSTKAHAGLQQGSTLRASAHAALQQGSTLRAKAHAALQQGSTLSTKAHAGLQEGGAPSPRLSPRPSPASGRGVGHLGLRKSSMSWGRGGVGHPSLRKSSMGWDWGASLRPCPIPEPVGRAVKHRDVPPLSRLRGRDSARAPRQGCEEQGGGILVGSLGWVGAEGGGEGGVAGPVAPRALVELGVVAA